MYNDSALLLQLGDRIRACRLQKGWTQADLAEYSDCNVSYMGSIERGERTPSFLFLYRLCHALDLPMDTLVQHLVPTNSDSQFPEKVYSLVSKLPVEKQKAFYQFTLRMLHLMNT